MNRVWKVATIIFALTTAALWSHPRQIAAPSSERAPSSRLDRAVLTRWRLAADPAGKVGDALLEVARNAQQPRLARLRRHASWAADVSWVVSSPWTP